MKTRAVVFPKADTFEMRDLTLDAPGPRDIVVRTLVSAISPGTERWTLRGLHLGTQFPCAPGYHRIGIVESAGTDVKNFEAGDVVYGSGSRWSEPVVSMWGAHVSMSVGDAAGYRLVSSTMPGRFELETLAFAIVSGVGVRGIRACDVTPGKKLAIIGAGYIGLCAAARAVLAGGDPLLVEKSPEHVRFAESLGLRAVVNDEAVGRKLAEFAPDGFDILYDTAGHAPTTDMLVLRMRRRGLILLQSQYFNTEKRAIDYDQIKVRELTIKTTCGTDNEDWLETTDLIRRRLLPIGPMITHRFGPADVLKGYELLHTGKPFNMGIVFNWSE